jgi:filamentous hemagglutinin family protein
VGQIRGSNLFHSFGQFNLFQGESATFTGPNTITNILSRVTGGSPSSIDGTIRSQIPGAHLYLLNPSGFMFGPNARLDVSGSFHVSTADYLRLADGATFAAHPAVPTVLSVAPPAAFGFLGPTPAAVSSQGSALHVLPGQTLAVIGGDIAIVGGMLQAPSGRINLVSVASPGEILVSPRELASELQMDSGAHQGRLELSGGALVTVSSEGRQNAGEVAVRAGTLTLTGGASIDGGTQGEGRGGHVTVVAHDMRLENGRILARTTSRSDGGEITVRAGTLRLTGGAEISSSTQGAGHGGRVTVVAHAVHIDNGQLSATASGRGDGGEITVEADTVLLQGRVTPTETFTGTSGQAQISGQTQGEGRGGRVTVVARDVRLENGLMRTRTFGDQDSGEITVEADTLTLTKMAEINSSSVGAGRGGNITVVARQAIALTGQDPGPARIASDALRTGAAGRVSVSAPTVRLDNGRIQAIDNESGSGLGGEVVVQGDTVTLSGGARISSSSFGAGQGGRVRVAATEAIRITDAGSVIASEAQGSGDAGRIDVAAPTVRLDARGSITAVAGGTTATGAPSAGKGGEITVQAGTLTLSGGARISSSTEGAGGGGNVTVRASEASITGGAQISSSSGRVGSRGQVVAGRGAGGDVTLSVTEALAIAGQDATGTMQSGVVSQTFGVGNAGKVTITTPRLTMAEGARIGTDTGGDGRAGDVVVEVGSAALTSGAQISSRSGIEERGALRVGTGAGGTVTLTATEGVTLAGQGSGLAASTAGSGQGGEITVRALRVELTEGAAISAASTGPGDAGNVILILGDTFVSTNGSVVTRATQADGGNIQITAPTMVRLRDSALTAKVGGGATTVGGNITIDPQFVVLQNSQIVANAFEGQGGNIRIQAQQVFLADPASQVSASSALGIDGVVNIQAPVTSISGAVAPLPQEFAPVAALLRDRCAGRLREGRVSRLVLGGRDGVPSEPGGLLLSPLMQTDLGEHGEQAGTPARTGQVQERVWYAQAGTLAGLETECARWTGHKGTTVGKKR